MAAFAGSTVFQYDVLPYLKAGSNALHIGANHTKEVHPGMILGLRIE